MAGPDDKLRGGESKPPKFGPDGVRGGYVPESGTDAPPKTPKTGSGGKK